MEREDNSQKKEMMNAAKCERFLKAVFEDDLDFYEKYILELSEEEQRMFFRENPEFMAEYPVHHGDVDVDLLKQPLYRGVLRKYKKYMDRKERTDS